MTATIGLRVRENHSTASKQVGSLVYGTRVTIEEENVDEGAYTGGHKNGEYHNGDWMALVTIDNSELLVSTKPAVMWG